MQAAEEARLRELRRKAREDAEVAVQRMKMQEQFERDRVIREKKLREEREIKKRALFEEQQRIKRKEEHMRQVSMSIIYAYAHISLIFTCNVSYVLTNTHT